MGAAPKSITYKYPIKHGIHAPKVLHPVKLYQKAQSGPLVTDKSASADWLHILNRQAHQQLDRGEESDKDNQVILNCMCNK